MERQWNCSGLDKQQTPSWRTRISLPSQAKATFPTKLQTDAPAINRRTIRPHPACLESLTGASPPVRRPLRVREELVFRFHPRNASRDASCSCELLGRGTGVARL